MMEQVAVVFAGLIMAGVTIRLVIDAVCEIVLAPMELQEPEMRYKSAPIAVNKAHSEPKKLTGTMDKELNRVAWGEWNEK